MQQHEPFFSFTVPTNESSASEHRSDDHTLGPVCQNDESSQAHSELTVVGVAQTDRSSPSGSVSPAAFSGRPGTNSQFAFNFSSTSSTEAEERTPNGATDDVSPLPSTPAGFATVDTSARRNSRQGLTIITSVNANARPNGRASFSGPVPPSVDANSSADSRGEHSNHGMSICPIWNVRSHIDIMFW